MTGLATETRDYAKLQARTLRPAMRSREDNFWFKRTAVPPLHLKRTLKPASSPFMWMSYRNPPFL
jgi:hypothetical protein